MQDEYENINFWHKGKPYRVEFCDKTDYERLRHGLIETIEITNINTSGLSGKRFTLTFTTDKTNENN